MIARRCQGITPSSRAGAYLDFLRARALSDHRSVPGNQAAYVLRRIEGDQVHFVTLTFWSTKEAIRAFAGEDIRRAKYYPEDRDFLQEFEPEVLHYEVCSPILGDSPGP